MRFKNWTREAQMAWAAGIFDGEGTCFLTVDKAIRVAVNQNDRRGRPAHMVLRFKYLFGGWIASNGRPRDGQKMHKWAGSHSVSVRAMEEMHPYLCDVKVAQYRKVRKQYDSIRTRTEDR